MVHALTRPVVHVAVLSWSCAPGGACAVASLSVVPPGSCVTLGASLVLRRTAAGGGAADWWGSATGSSCMGLN